jgi:hypothetical protein
MKVQSEPSSQTQSFICSAGNDIVALAMLIIAGYKPAMGWQSILSSQERKMQLACSRAIRKDPHKRRKKSQVMGQWRILTRLA